MVQDSFWIMRPFSPLFYTVFAVFILILTASSLLLRKSSETKRRAVLVGACLVTLVGFFIYKYFLSLDGAYNEITANMGGFNWWGELPLHLCNINMILIPVAVLRRNRPLMSFCFFLGPLGAVMALIMPGNGFDGYPLLLPRMLGFYGTHFMVMIEGLALASFGLYRPRFSDLPRTILASVAILFGIFGINLLLRWSGLHPHANYFYSVETEGNALLELFYRWVPFPCLYLLPSLLILGGYMALIMLGFTLADALKARRAPKSSPRGENPPE
ncbi:MAG: YwaF family protein [Oscillospiraceae bacterium]|nr:YwaF family protein [Oscillospiraceae bacterium]